MKGFLEFVAGGVRRIVAIGAAFLPARWWPALEDHVPVSSSALVAAIVTIVAAAAIGIPGFLHHVEEVVSGNNAAIIDLASRPDVKPASDRDWGQMIVMGGGLALFTFMLTTPAGWLSTYLAISGVWRAMGCIVDHSFGDPILTALDAALHRGVRRRRERGLRKQREALEGPEVADRLVSAAQAGIDGADLVIVASRVKPQWDKGTVLMTGEGEYRIVSIEERTIAGRLRTFYALRAHADLEAFRRTVQYDLPPRRLSQD
jgi:hypothetical protein